MSEYFVETQNMVEMDVAVEDNNLDMDASANQNVPMTTDQTTRVIEAISPTAEVTRVEGGAKITITDKNGTTEATINDGQDGTDGEKGDQGDPGPMPDFSIGNVSTGAPGSDASVTITGTPAEPYLNFTIPRGDKGEDGGGVPSGGTTGQFLKKASTTDFDVEWDSVPDPTNKADKVSGATSGNFAGLDSNGNLTDSGHKHSDYLTSHQDISGKADKVSSATSGNFAGLDGNGNLTDSGHKHSDYLTQHQDISGKLDKPVTAGTSGQVLTSDGNGGQTWQTPSGGTVTDVQEDGTSILSSGVANILTMTGASSSSAGTKGLVPAPSSGEQNLVLTGAGSWQVSPGAKLHTVSGTMTGTTLTISDDYITADMKCFLLELGTPSAFDDTIHVLPANGSVTISCASFSGSSTVTATLQKVIVDPLTVTSTEFDVLNNRINNLNWHEFAGDSLLTTQVDALDLGKTYTGYIPSYGNMSATGMPTDANFNLQVFCTSDGYRKILAYPVHSNRIFERTESAWSWGDWTEVSSQPKRYAVSPTIPKNNGTYEINLTTAGITTSHSYWVTGVGSNGSWNYAGILFYTVQNSSITRLTGAYLTASVSGSTLTFTNTHPDWAQTVAIEIVGTIPIA